MARTVDDALAWVQGVMDAHQYLHGLRPLRSEVDMRLLAQEVWRLRKEVAEMSEGNIKGSFMLERAYRLLAGQRDEAELAKWIEDYESL